MLQISTCCACRPVSCCTNNIDHTEGHHVFQCSTCMYYQELVVGVITPGCSVLLCVACTCHCLLLRRPETLLALRSGMYLGSAAAMLVLPSVVSVFGPAALLRLVGCQGLAWLALWLAVGRDVPHRCVYPKWRRVDGVTLGHACRLPVYLHTSVQEQTALSG